MPVHKWLLRHVYYPCMRLGMGKWWAGTVVFAISAAFHELLIGLPLHMITFWAFIGLMCQVRIPKKLHPYLQCEFACVVPLHAPQPAEVILEVSCKESMA